ncbi:MAG: sulfatase [Deltaproteobacteria bacterium]|nr:sulfatase [Deltaproteobacteria bacterium]
MARRLITWALALGSFAMVDAAEAACSASSDATLVKKSLKQAVRCDYKVLRSGPGTCNQVPPPACADTLVGDADALAYGANNPPAGEVDSAALRAQLKCQKRIGKAVSHYVGTKLRYLVKGRPAAEAEAKAIRHLDKLADDCTVTVAQDTATQIVLPSVGPQCGAAIPPPGGAVNTTALRDCLRQLLEVWVDRNGPDPQPLRPNILFILTDDQRWDTTDDTHSPVPGQPIMPGVRAELGGSGVEFVNAFMGTPLCCPSRSSILRGQYAHNTGVYTNTGLHGGADDFVPLQGETMGTLLQAAGYRTGFLGKYMNGYQQLWPNNQTPYIPPGWTVWGAFRNVAYFDYALVENGVRVNYGSTEADYSTDVLREKAKQFITDSVVAGQPFFLHLSFKAPHGPWVPAPRHVGKFAGLPPWRPASYNEPDVSDKPTWMQNTPQLDAQGQADLDAIRIAQLEMLQAVDEAIGGSTTYGITGIMQHMRDLGIADDTLVVYFADNGWHWGEHRTQAKNKPYEESIRAPMFIRYPKLAPLPRNESRFALNIDFCPTFVELARRASDPPPTVAFDGTSLVRLLDGTAPSWRTDFLTEGWPADHVWATLREPRWKYTELPLLPGDPNSTFEKELYDLDNDPYELANLAGDSAYTTMMADMAARIRVLRPAWPDDSDATEEDEEE